MAHGRDRKKRLRATLEDCEIAIDYLEEAENYDLGDEYHADSLKVRIRDYPEGSGVLFLFLTWYGAEKPGAGDVPIPPGWRLEGEWFFAEMESKYGNMPVWQVGLEFEGVNQ